MNLCDYDKRTVLHIAVSENQEHIVEFLLGECDLTKDVRTVKDRWGMTPLEAAKSEAIPEVYTKFLKYCKELIDTENDDYRTFQLINAAAIGDLTTLKQLNDKKIDMNLMDYDRRTALHLAAAEGQTEAVKYLVETSKVNVSVSDRWNRYPVDEAKDNDIKEFLQISREHRDTPPFHKISPARKTMAHVMDAALRGILHTVKGYEYFTMDSSDYLGNTPLHVAASEARLNDVKYLLEEKHVSPFVRNSIMKTPLDLVEDKIENLKDDNTDCIETKMQRMPSISWANDFFRIKRIIATAMENARTENVTEDIKFVQHTKDERIFLFLNKAYKGDIRAIRRYMITDKTLVNEVDYDKRSALHLAVAERHHHLIKFLLEVKECRVNINAEDRWKKTPLMEAIRIGDEAAISLLKAALQKQSQI